MNPEQPNKQGYCPTCRSIRVFIQHADHKDRWICTSCTTTIGDPRPEAPAFETKPRKLLRGVMGMYIE